MSEEKKETVKMPEVEFDGTEILWYLNGQSVKDHMTIECGSINKTHIEGNPKTGEGTVLYEILGRNIRLPREQLFRSVLDLLASITENDRRIMIMAKDIVKMYQEISGKRQGTIVDPVTKEIMTYAS